jgi:PTS system nitrogen regulatory IIA component
MAPTDFDIDRLAQYLHLTPAQVTKMASRGKLPGRKVGGQWRFPEAEIHHWLEQRIGATDDDEALARMEGLLERAPGPEEEIRIAELLPIHAIAVPLLARTRQSVITHMVELAEGTGWLWDPDKMGDALRDRESMHPTALENGVALLHPRRPQAGILAQPFLALGCTPQGIPFGAPDGRLTDVFFLICSTDDRGHLRTLARLCRLIGDPELLAAIRAAPDPAAVHQQIVAFEQQGFA